MLISAPLLAVSALLVGTSAPPPSGPVGASVRTGRIVAVDAAGDAVLLGSLDASGAGEPQVLFEADDPDDPPGEAGPTTFIDGIAVDAAGTVAYVGTCCEPTSGSTFVVEIGRRAEPEPLPGSAPTLSADGASLALASAGAMLVVDTASGAVTTIQTPGFTTWDVGWAGDDQLATYGVTEAQTYEIRLYGMDGAHLASSPASVEQFAPWLVAIVGVDADGALVVLDQPQEGGPTSLHRLELPTLAPLEDRGSLPDGVLSASLSGDGRQLLWVDAERHLHLDDGEPFPGEYIWADWA